MFDNLGDGTCAAHVLAHVLAHMLAHVLAHLSCCNSSQEAKRGITLGSHFLLGSFAHSAAAAGTRAQQPWLAEWLFPFGAIL